MGEDGQGEGAVLKRPVHVLQVLWDPAKQEVSLNFKADEFRTWEMVLMVLEGAKNHAESVRRQTQVAQLQEQLREQALAEQVLAKLQKN